MVNTDTKQKLIGKIAQRIVRSRCEVCGNCGASISTDNPDDVAKEILVLIEESGEEYILPRNCQDCKHHHCFFSDGGLDCSCDLSVFASTCTLGLPDSCPLKVWKGI